MHRCAMRPNSSPFQDMRISYARLPKHSEFGEETCLGFRKDSSCMHGCWPVMMAHSSKPKL